MSGVCEDPASEVINVIMKALKRAFDPEFSCPSDAKVSPTVRFFAGEGMPLEAWNAHAQATGCDEPLLWVRVINRYPSQRFPDPMININPCGLPEVIALEIGIARCCVVDANPSWDEYATEAEQSLDDSWRVKNALCAAMSYLKDDHQVGTDRVEPFGPEGGVLGWAAKAYVQV